MAILPCRRFPVFLIPYMSAVCVFQLLYFSVAANPHEGFLRALSVASGTHMPRLPARFAAKKQTASSSRPASQAR